MHMPSAQADIGLIFFGICKFSACQRPILTHDSIVWLFFTLTHYQTTNSRLFKTERVRGRQFQIGRKWQKAIQTGRKHCGKRRNCSLRAISPFPIVFSKGLLPRGVKRCYCVGMGQTVHSYATTGVI